MGNEAKFSVEMNAKIKKALGDALETSAMLVLGKAKELAPFGKTGELGNRIFVDIDKDKLTARVYTDLSYAPFVEYMTKAHIIRPRFKKSLAWGKNIGTLPNGDNMKEVVLRKGQEVHHPGTQAQPFMRPALDTSTEEINRIFAKAINNIR